jgi:hypothetical protein
MSLRCKKRQPVCTENPIRIDWEMESRGLWLSVRTSYYAHKHRTVSRRGGMKYSRAVSMGVGYILGIIGGIVLIRGFDWGMYLVTSSYFLILVTVVLGTLGHLVGHRGDGTARQTPVCFWPVADMHLRTANVRFRGNGHPLFLGKMSANDRCGSVRTMSGEL